MYLLDSLLSREQSRLLNAVQSAAAESGLALYLTGGAMRDMLGGFPIRDLDFTIEGLPGKLSKSLVKSLPDLAMEEDPVRKAAELRLPCGVTGSLRMARIEKVTKPGGVPKVTPALILEDLSRRDFTINAMAISLAKASRGLIRDPINGQSDLHNREIRTCYSQAFFDDPVRILRAVRFKHRLSFQLEERTQRQLANAVEERWFMEIPAQRWGEELHAICEENDPSEILNELQSLGLLPVKSDLNLPGLARFEKLRRMIPGRAAAWPLFLHVVTQEMKANERAAFLRAFALKPSDLEFVKKIKPRVSKLAASIKSPQLRRPSQIFQAIAPGTSAEILYLLYESDQRIIQDRLRNYFQKYLPTASEVTDAQVEASGVKPGTPQFEKAKAAMIAARLNAHAPHPTVANGAPSAAAPPPVASTGPQTRAAR